MRVYYDLFKNLPRIIVARDFCPTQLTQTRCKDVVKTSYFGLKVVLDWSEMEVATNFF